MDGSVSTTSAASVRQYFKRNHTNSSNGSASDAAIRTALFEQLLSFSIPVQTMPQAVEPAVEPQDQVDSSAESKAEAVEENQDPEESETEPGTPNLSLAVVDPKLPIQPLPDKNNQHDFGTLPTDGKGKAQLADAKVAPEAKITAQVANTTEPALATETEQPLADIGGEPIQEHIKPVDVDNEHRSTDRTAINKIEQTSQIQTEPAVSLETQAPTHRQQKSSSSQPGTLNAQVANNVIQQASATENQDRRERWFEREAESKLPALEQSLTNDSRISTESTESFTPADHSGGDDRPNTTPTVSVSPAPSSTNPSDAVLASAIVQAQSQAAATAVKASAPVAIDRSNSQLSTESVQGTTTTSKANTDVKSDRSTAKENAKTELSQQERVRLVQRIARSFNRMSAGGGQINLRLHPEQLGALSVQVNIDGKSMSAQLTTETEEARDIILKELPVLKQRLAEQGYDVTKFQVEVAGQGTETNFGQTNNGQSFADQRDHRNAIGQMDYRRLATRSSAETSNVRTSASAGFAPTTGIDLLG
jgi:flagellar hook-length control protein FliK